MSAATCPTCGSPSVHMVPVPRRSVGKAVLAELALGTAAGVAAGSSTVLQAACASCGAQWFPGTKEERRMRALAGQLGEQAMTTEQKIVRLEERAAQKREAAQKERDRWGCIAAIIGVLILLVLGNAAS